MIIIKGAGDLASGVAIRLHQSGMPIVMTEIPEPTAIRRTVSFCTAVRENHVTIEGVTGKLAASAEEALTYAAAGYIAVLVDPEAACRKTLQPIAIVDAILAKRNIGTTMNDAPVVVALGPGFTAGVDCHAVIETMRGHNLGRVILEGNSHPNTGIPGNIDGYTSERVLRAPDNGSFEPRVQIGDLVQRGALVAEVSGSKIHAAISGIVRGLLPPGIHVVTGDKCGDIDPRCELDHCFTVSDKSRALGGAVLEALLRLTHRLDRKEELWQLKSN